MLKINHSLITEIVRIEAYLKSIKPDFDAKMTYEYQEMLLAEKEDSFWTSEVARLSPADFRYPFANKMRFERDIAHQKYLAAAKQFYKNVYGIEYEEA